MNFKNLKKNDIIFCESNSRVLKLVEKQNGIWKTQDLFSNQPVKLTSNQRFKLVETHRKIQKPISMLRLLEQEDDVPSTLTEKEVFIVDYLLSEVDQSLLHRAHRLFSEMTNIYEIRKVVKQLFEQILKYTSTSTSISDTRLLQYVLCAIENLDGSEINTSTEITRLSSFNYNRTEVVEKVEYISWSTTGLPSYDKDYLNDRLDILNDHFWDLEPDSSHSDYSDGRTLKWEDEELSLEQGPLVIR